MDQIMMRTRLRFMQILKEVKVKYDTYKAHASPEKLEELEGFEKEFVESKNMKRDGLSDAIDVSGFSRGNGSYREKRRIARNHMAIFFHKAEILQNKHDKRVKLNLRKANRKKKKKKRNGKK